MQTEKAYKRTKKNAGASRVFRLVLKDFHQAVPHSRINELFQNYD